MSNVPTVGVLNVGTLATGILDAPTLDAEALLVRDGRIAAIGTASAIGARDADGTPVDLSSPSSTAGS